MKRYLFALFYYRCDVSAKSCWCGFLFLHLVYDVWMGHHLHMEMRPY